MRRYWFCGDHWDEGVVWESAPDAGQPYTRLVVGSRVIAYLAS